jgi:hypothetical protein
MTLRAFREVGKCGCHESLASARLRELIRSLQQEVRDARRAIEELDGGRGHREKRRGPAARLVGLDGESQWIQQY